MRNLILASCLATALVCSEQLQTDHDGNVIARPIPEFPSNFHAVVTIIAHLVDKKEEYPPWKKVVEIWFDAQTQRAKSYVHAGYDANKTFLRRWDTRDEYCFRNDQHSECRRGFLSEPMPESAFPRNVEFQPTIVRAHPAVYPGAATVDTLDKGVGEEGYLHVNEWHAVDQDALIGSRYRIYFDTASNIPFGITSETLEGTTWQPLMTWTFTNFTIDSTTDADFAVGSPWNHTSCSWKRGGWPSLHLFGPFLRV